MNGKERINAVMNGMKPDRVPFMPHNFMMAADELGVSMKNFRKSAKTIADVFESTVYKYEFDGIVVDVDTAVLAEAIGVPVDFPDDEPARTNGVLLSNLGDINLLKKQNIESSGRISIVLEAVELLRQRLGGEIYIRGNCDQAPFTLAGMVRGIQDWLIDIVTEDDEKIHALLEFCTNITCQYVKLMANAGADMISNGDSSAGCSVISPELYRKYALPYEKLVAETSHSCRKPYMLHICGDVNSILKDMKDTGADSLELDSKTDIHLIHDTLKDSVVFSGNIDPVNVIRFGTVFEVEQKTKELLLLYKDSPRLILNAGCAIVPGTPEENIRCICNMLKN